MSLSDCICPNTQPYAQHWCAFHCKNEPIPENVFRVCGECWHAFTAEELIAEDAKWSPDGEVRPAEEIYICPLCIHDF